MTDDDKLPKRKPSSTTLSTSILKKQLAKNRLQVKLAELLEQIAEMKKALPDPADMPQEIVHLEYWAKEANGAIERMNDE